MSDANATYTGALAIPISELDLSSRATHCLTSDGLQCLGQVVECAEMELMRIPGFGRKSLNELKDLLASFGMVLGEQEQQAVTAGSKVARAIGLLRDVGCIVEFRGTTLVASLPGTDLPASEEASGRNIQIYLARAQGKTLREIGREFHLTPERVRQIILGVERRERRLEHHRSERESVAQQIREAMQEGTGAEPL